MASIFVPEDFYCPITGELMKDPVSEPDGHTYERNAIEKWIMDKGTSPMTRKYIGTDDLKPNLTLKKSICLFLLKIFHIFFLIILSNLLLSIFLLIIYFKQVDEKPLILGSKFVFIPIPTIKNFFFP